MALVIGNNDYRGVPVLTNPANDADDVAASLTRLGFEVQRVKNGTFDDMRKGLLEFARRARGSEVAIVFYAGHGMEVGGENYLIPIDAELKADVDVDHEAIALKTVTPLVENASRLGIVILDACRNNPFSAKMQRTIRTRAVSRGLAAVEPTGNVLIAFSAREGTTAADGFGRNSPFTSSLLRHLETPGLEINFLFRNVRDDVLKLTKREQLPFVYGSLSSEAIYLKAALPVAIPLPPRWHPRAPMRMRWGGVRCVIPKTSRRSSVSSRNSLRVRAGRTQTSGSQPCRPKRPLPMPPQNRPPMRPRKWQLSPSAANLRVRSSSNSSGSAVWTPPSAPNSARRHAMR